MHRCATCWLSLFSFLLHHTPTQRMHHIYVILRQAGRLVDIKPTQTTATNYVFHVTKAGTVKHVTVFMTGAAPFTAGTVKKFLPF